MSDFSGLSCAAMSNPCVSRSIESLPPSYDSKISDRVKPAGANVMTFKYFW
jgi:hypothetical protein